MGAALSKHTNPVAFVLDQIGEGTMRGGIPDASALDGKKGQRCEEKEKQTHHAILNCVAWKLLESRLHLSNRWLTLRENDYELPGGKRLPSYWLIEKPAYV